MFSSSEVAIDLKLSDAKRLLPPCGTFKKKGAAGIAERPHRRTAVVAPDHVRRLRGDDLAQLLARIRDDCDEAGRAAVDLARGIRPTKPGPTKAAPSNRGVSPFDLANDLDPTSVAEWLDLFESGSLRCPGCGESQGVDVIDHGLKCLHNRCAGKGREGFRTNVDLVAEVRGVDPREAVNLLAERFGFEGLRERVLEESHAPRAVAANRNDAPAERAGFPAATSLQLQRLAVAPKVAESTLRIWTPEEIFAPLPEQAFAVSGLLVKGSLALVVALGESLKTWMAVDAVMATATGGKWLGRFDCAKGEALFVDYEAGDYEWRRRALRLAAGRELVLPVQGMGLVSMPPCALTSEEFFQELERLATRYALIAIDSLTGGAGGADENDARFAAPLYRLKSIAARTGCVIIVLHHARKSAPAANGEPDPREMVRGSSAIFNAVDVVLYLTRDGDDRFRVSQSKARGGKKIDPFTVRVDDVDERASIVRSGDVGDQGEDDDGAADAFGVVKGKVVRLIAREHDLRSATEVYRRIKGTKKTVLEAVRELEERRVIVKREGAFRLTSEDVR